MNSILLSTDARVFIGRQILDSDNGKWAYHRMQAEYGISYGKFVESYNEDFLADFDEVWNRLPLAAKREHLAAYRRYLDYELISVKMAIEKCGIEAEIK